MTPRLFKAENNERAGEFKEFLPVNVNLRFETLAPHLAYCEGVFVRPLLGDVLFESLAGFYDDFQSSGSADEDELYGELLRKVRFALVRLALWKGFDMVAASVSDAGFSSVVDKENRLYRYQEENLKSALKGEGFDGLDDVLSFLEGHIDTFSQFSQSQYHTFRDHTLIKDTGSFDRCYNINGSRLVFLKMSQFVRDFERLDLCHRIGKAFFEVLLTADESLPKYAAILPDIRMAVVYGAVADGIGELHKMPTEKGLVFESQSAGGESNVELMPVERVQLAETRNRFGQKSERYLASAINYIKDNISDYPEYADFAGDSPADGVTRFDNKGKKFFMA